MKWQSIEFNVGWYTSLIFKVNNIYHLVSASGKSKNLGEYFCRTGVQSNVKVALIQVIKEHWKKFIKKHDSRVSSAENIAQSCHDLFNNLMYDTSRGLLQFMYLYFNMAFDSVSE